MRVDVQQDTKQWHDLRESRLGASDAATIMGLNPYKTALQLYKEKKEGKRPFINAAMLHGKKLEPQARETYNALYGMNFEPAVFIHDEFDWLIASLDGYDDGHILEIKCPSNQEIHFKAMNGEIPSYYMPQMTQQAFVSNTDKEIVHYWSFHETLPPARILYKIDPTFTEEMLDALFKFKECLDTDTPPDHEDEVTVEEADRLIQARITIMEANKWKRKADAEKELLKEYFKRPVRAKGILISKSKTAGRVDYKQAEKDLGVDFSRWKSEPVETLRISTY